MHSGLATVALMLTLLAADTAAAADNLEVGIEDERLMLTDARDAERTVGEWSRAGVEVVRVHAIWGRIAPAGRRAPARFTASDPEDPHYSWHALDHAVHLTWPRCSPASAAGLEGGAGRRRRIRTGSWSCKVDVRSAGLIPAPKSRSVNWPRSGAPGASLRSRSSGRWRVSRPPIAPGGRAPAETFVRRGPTRSRITRTVAGGRRTARHATRATHGSAISSG